MQTALTLERKEGNFVFASIPIPKPGPEEVLVKIHSAALNPVDWKIQKYGWWIEEYPTVLGTDLAGEVVELGEGVKGKIEVGDKVFFQGSYGSSKQNGFQQYAVADVHTLGKIPSNVSFDEAATIPVAITAAYTGLYSAKPAGLGFEVPVTKEGRGKYAGKGIVVLGGASSVGQYAIQLARVSGFDPIVATASLKHETYLKSLGATHIVDRSVPLNKEGVEKIAGAPIACVFDSIASSQTQNDGLDIIGSGGELETKAKAEKQGTTIIHTLGLKTLPEHVQVLREFWAHAGGLLERGEIKPNRVEVLPKGLGGVVGGLERLYNNRVSGVKLVVRPQETA